MTQGKKQILLKDLCARVPYGVRYKGDHGWPINPYQHTTSLCTILESKEPLLYLRPMSSMTEEELSKFMTFKSHIRESECKFHIANYDMIDWLNANHFDYRNLIEKGLALEAPEDMYKEE